MAEATESTERKPMSRKFFYWFLGIQFVPIAGIVGASGLVKLWVLIVFGNACVFFFNLSRYHGRRKPGADAADAKAERLLLLGACATWALLALVWGGVMGRDMYLSGSFGL